MLAGHLKSNDLRFGPFNLDPEEPRMFAYETCHSLATQDQWRNYFKFAFVRNPWDWLVSIYHNLCQSAWPSNRLRLGYAKNKQRLLQKSLSALGLRQEHFTFKRFLRDCVVGDVVQDRWDFHWKPQHLHVCDKRGRLIVDYVGRFESLSSDLAHISERIGLPASLPHLNRTEHRPYQDYYDAQARSWVAQKFRKDIDMFRYRFKAPG